jgi:hypothetical protein
MSRRSVANIQGIAPKVSSVSGDVGAISADLAVPGGPDEDRRDREGVQAVPKQIGAIAAEVRSVAAEVEPVSGDVGAISPDVAEVAGSQIAAEIRSVPTKVEPVRPNVAPVGTNVG